MNSFDFEEEEVRRKLWKTIDNFLKGIEFHFDYFKAFIIIFDMIVRRILQGDGFLFLAVAY